MLARLALERDEQAVVDLASAAAAESFPKHAFDADRVRRNFHCAITQADPTLFVVEYDRELVGFGTASLADYPYTAGFYAMIDVLYIRPASRGTRAAAVLVQALIEWADRVGAKETLAGPGAGLQVEQVSRFLQHFGFEPTGCILRRVLHAA